MQEKSSAICERQKICKQYETDPNALIHFPCKNALNRFCKVLPTWYVKKAEGGFLKQVPNVKSAKVLIVDVPATFIGHIHQCI